MAALSRSALLGHEEQGKGDVADSAGNPNSEEEKDEDAEVRCRSRWIEGHYDVEERVGGFMFHPFEDHHENDAACRSEKGEGPVRLEFEL